MNLDFTVERITLHLINKKEDKFTPADHEINMSAFTKQEDVDAIKSFFSGHLRLVWDAPEGNTIRAASFLKDSEIRKQYNSIKADNSQFLAQSGNMAESLFKIAPKNSSTGLLMALWFSAPNDKRQFLALFKMDPGRSDKIALRSRGNQLLLDLAVQHIDQALPDPGDRVLKWAVTPHPSRLYDVKIKDSQSTPDPAIYFTKFLGCEARKTEKQQVSDLLQGLPQTAVDKLLPKIDIASVGGRVSFDSIEKSSALTKPQIETLEKALVAAGSRDLAVSSKALRTVRLGYRLSNEIVIKGPLAAMNSVKVTRLGKNDFEFRIRANDYEKFYE